MVTRRAAGWLANARPLPTALRAVFGYYADTGVFDYASLQLKRETDDRLERMVADVFEQVEEALADEFDREAVEFSYDTKLLLPAQLSLGYAYRQARTGADADPVTEEIAAGLPVVNDETLAGEEDLAPRERVVRAERMTRLAVEALLDGDMRDAINDAEYADFEVDFETGADGRRRVAEVAQRVLEDDLAGHLDRLPDVVQERYDAAVDYSEAHQNRDEHFRDLLRAAEDGDQDARDAIGDEYVFAPYDDPPEVFDETERTLPYSKTQYARVGVLYDAMLELYRMAGLGIDRQFAKAIVLSIIGAQIWLDDVDDYDDDWREGQLTPVTAEYVLAEDDGAAYDNVLEVTERYLDLAKTHATEADSPLTGIAIEYIYRSGDPGVLPGSDEASGTVRDNVASSRV